MTWCGIEGHDKVVELFRQSVRRGRMASSYLFVGPPGIGKSLFAKTLAQAFLCERRTESQLNPCQRCPSCLQIQSDSHPDVDRVVRPEGKSFIPVELFIGDREHRSREGLCHRISLRPSSGRRRVAIIDDADWLNQEGANSLLKTLEEPPPRSLLILIGTSQQRQLPTIRSRCQVIRFQPLTDSFVRSHLLEGGLVEDPADVDTVTRMADGSLDRAKEYADPALRQFGLELDSGLRQPNVDSLGIAKMVQAFVEAVGRDAPVRRKRLRQVVQLRMLVLRDQIRSITAEQTTFNEHAAAQLEVALERMDRCLAAFNEIDGNANLPTLIECWVDDDYQAAARRMV